MSELCEKAVTGNTGLNIKGALKGARTLKISTYIYIKRNLVISWRHHRTKEVTMRTTLNLDDHLLISAKRRAVEENASLACVIENVFREFLAKPRAMRETIRLMARRETGGEPG